jgi:hypothetical protein
MIRLLNLIKSPLSGLPSVDFFPEYVRDSYCLLMAAEE